MRNIDLAKDIVQDAFEVLWNNKENIQAEKGRQYLFTVVYRKGIDVFRRDRNDMTIDESHMDLKSTQSFESAYSDKEFVHQAMAHLPETHRQLVLLRDLEGYDYKEIEEITGLNQSQVKVYLFRARKMLKETITKMEAI
jgi:RNA polymerase sigma factor (sigma-70 family)